MEETDKQVDFSPLPDSGQFGQQPLTPEPSYGNENKPKKGRVFIYVAMIILVVFIVIGLRGLKNTVKTEEDLPVNEELGELDNNLTNYPDYSQLANMKKLELVKDFASWAPNSQLVNKYLKNIAVKESGKISRGYIYVKATVGDKAFTKFDSFYLKFNQNGGHLFRPASLAVPSSSLTELLYPLENVSYLPAIPYDETRTPEVVNWQNLFGDGKKIYIFTFISSQRPAKILELSIYYDCQDQSECLLSIN